LNTSGKRNKLLVLGGASQHCKVVEAAHDLGMEVHVTDYLTDSPAKMMADIKLMYNIFDVDEIVDYCRREKIDGVISTSLDVCQIPYQEICERLDKPCFGNRKQFLCLTNKNAFKQVCMDHGVDIIKSYTLQDIVNESREVEFPLLIKPCDHSGSKGQQVCFDMKSAKAAIASAAKASASGEVVIEKYMADAEDFASAYMVVNGEVNLVRTCDRYTGSKEYGLDQLCTVAVCPSKYTQSYINNIDTKVINMIRGLGIQNGPVFMQGIVDGNTVRFYDPGLRFAGGEYERLLRKITNIDLMKMLVWFSVSGKMEADTDLGDVFWLRGKTITHYDPMVLPGKICRIEGKEKILEDSRVISFYSRYREGEIVPEKYDVSRRFAEICFITEVPEEQVEMIHFIQNTLHIFDEQGNEMICDVFQTDQMNRGR
jgi:Biotin carboxylase